MGYKTASNILLVWTSPLRERRREREREREKERFIYKQNKQLRGSLGRKHAEQS
jgi:hypothetical protein